MSIAFTVPDLACSACVDTVTKAIQAIDTTAQVKADPTTKQVEALLMPLSLPSSRPLSVLATPLLDFPAIHP